MNRRSILSISAMTSLGLVLLSGNAIAQQKTLKEQLVGTWTAVSVENTATNGSKRHVGIRKNATMLGVGDREE